MDGGAHAVPFLALLLAGTVALSVEPASASAGGGQGLGIDSIDSVGSPPQADAPWAVLVPLIDEYAYVLDMAVADDAAKAARVEAAFGEAMAGVLQRTNAAAMARLLCYSLQQVHQARQRIAKDRLQAAGGPHTVLLADITAAAAPWLHALFLAILGPSAGPESRARGFVDLPGALGHTALQLAAAFMDHGAMAALLARGGDPRVAPGARMTALHFAARNCDAAAARMLVGAGADTRALTALHREVALDLAPKLPYCLESLATALGVPVPGAQPGPAACSETARGGGGGDKRSYGGGGGWRAGHTEQDAGPAVPDCAAVFPVHDAAGGLTADTFVQRHIRLAAPAVLVNALPAPAPAAAAAPGGGGGGGWDLGAFSRAQLRRKDVDVWVSPIPYGDVYGINAGLATFAEYLDYMDQQAQEHEQDAAHARPPKAKEPLYVFDAEVLKKSFEGQYSLLPALQAAWDTATVERAQHQLYLGESPAASAVAAPASRVPCQPLFSGAARVPYAPACSKQRRPHVLRRACHPRPGAHFQAPTCLAHRSTSTRTP